MNPDNFLDLGPAWGLRGLFRGYRNTGTSAGAKRAAERLAAQRRHIASITTDKAREPRPASRQVLRRAERKARKALRREGL